MIWLFTIGVVVCFAVGVFTPWTWKYFLLIGLVSFLTFGIYGFLFFTVGSLVSLIDDYLLKI